METSVARAINQLINRAKMPKDTLFKKIVGNILPTAIPVDLEKVDELTVGKVLIYSKKPRKLIPMRKHDLAFTGWSLQSLLTDEKFSFTTARSYLFDSGKNTSSASVTVDLDASVDMKSALLKLASLDTAFKFDVEEDKTLTVSSDFGKITHISTDVVTTILGGKHSVDINHPIVKKAIDYGGNMFVVTAVYEAERCNLSVTLSKDKKEKGGAANDKDTKDSSSENVEDKHGYTQGMFFLLCCCFLLTVCLS